MTSSAVPTAPGPPPPAPSPSRVGLLVPQNHSTFIFSMLILILIQKAGSTVKVLWTSVYHLGPSAIYATRDVDGKPSSWVKVWEETRVGNGWSSDKIEANNHILEFPVPSGMANGRWLFRIEHLGLHVASSPGGAQFYIRCFDANIVNGGSSTGSPTAQLPGAYNTNTPGVVWNPYSGDQSKYPSFGPAVASFSGGGNPNPVTTTTTRIVDTTQPPVTSRTTTTTTTRTTTTTTTVSQPTNCAAKYGQCGGQGWTGPTCCKDSTCKSSNQWYSQCFPLAGSKGHVIFETLSPFMPFSFDFSAMSVWFQCELTVGVLTCKVTSTRTGEGSDC
uniref:lytic cellulose monooxygenase (C4-dehydrogenating) n=1 Tax=Rhizophlyctis rosea TaxID=64517 RepID=A0A2U8U9P2_9FUNG|nr:lytic polysaccharide monooxygenase 9 [Rhizophlyctis rosea]